MCVYICVCMYVCVFVFVYIYIYIYIYIHVKISPNMVLTLVPGDPLDPTVPYNGGVC